MQRSGMRAMLAVSVFLGVSFPEAVADKVYWVEHALGAGVNRIPRANLDGSNVELLIGAHDVIHPDDIALDAAGGKLYWVESRDPAGIYWANLDGTAPELLLPFAGILDIAIDSDARKIYWAPFVHLDPRTILRADLDGTNVEEVVELGSNAFHGIDLDPDLGRVYFSQGTSIRRVNVDGTELVTLVEFLESAVSGLALDLTRGKIYFTLQHVNKIQRANLDGSSVEDVVTGLGAPVDIALDVPRGKMYWVDPGVHLIRRANLDGTNVETVTSEAWGPYGIVLDLDCDNGVVDPGEACDIAIPEGSPGACPTTCLDDDPCTTDTLLDSGSCAARCEFAPITVPIDNDGCCPEGANVDDDNDCAAVCGNGVCEPGEDEANCPADCAGPIPTLSQWGIAIMALLLLAGGRIWFGRRCQIVGT